MAGQDRRERAGDADDSEQIGLELGADVRKRRPVEHGCVLRLMPALLTTIDTSVAASAAAATELSSVTSSTSRTMRWFGGVCGDLEVAYTFPAPRSSSSSTIARPKLRLPPVTSTRLPRSACQVSRG